MKRKKSVIDLFEEAIPKELIPIFPENDSQKSKDAFEKAREFLFKDASTEYFNLFFRKI
mgnify:CR=1 FL=1